MSDKPVFNSILSELKSDSKRYPRRWYVQPGFWVTVSYRIRRLRKLGSFYCRFLLPVDMFMGFVRRCLSDVILPSEAIIGEGLYLPHAQGIVIHEDAEIGDGVSIFQQVTVGEWNGGVPKIDDGCALYAGAKVFGGICLGRSVKVGANAVVVDSFSDNQVAAGVPAKAVTKRGVK